MADAHKNFAYSLVGTAPSPAASGTSLVVGGGDGAKFPAVPFNATIWPAGVQPTTANAEIVRVTAKSTDTFTITRSQETSSARTILVGDQIAATITAKTLTDAEYFTEVTTTAIGTQDNFNPGITGHTHIRCNNASDLTITGFTIGTPGQMILLTTLSTGNVFLKHNSGSGATQRLYNNLTVSNTPIASASSGIVGSALYIYDGQTLIWRLIEHNQGAWIPVAYSGGNFTATGGGSWTVSSGDVLANSYWLKGRTLLYNIDLISTDISGTVTNLNIALPFTAVSRESRLCWLADNNVFAIGELFVNSSASMQVSKWVIAGLTANFTAGVGTTGLRGEISFEVT